MGDAAVADRAPNAATPRPSLALFVVGGADLVRPGSTLGLRLERQMVGDAQTHDVTGAAAFRVQPPYRGEIDRGGNFHAIATGRVEIIAALGGEEVRILVEVSTDLPAGLASIPVLQVSDGRAAHSVRFEAQTDGTISIDIQTERRSLRLRGRRTGNAFPITVSVREQTSPAPSEPRDGSVSPAPATGRIMLDRWAARRLDGHAVLRLADGPFLARFTVLLDDPAPLLTHITR
jgi:hypothetical protein